jgi:hypothetical protein
MEEKILRERLLWVYEKLLNDINVSSNLSPLQRAKLRVEIKDGIAAAKSSSYLELQMISKIPEIMKALSYIEGRINEPDFEILKHKEPLEGEK